MGHSVGNNKLVYKTHTHRIRPRARNLVWGRSKSYLADIRPTYEWKSRQCKKCTDSLFSFTSVAILVLAQVYSLLVASPSCSAPGLQCRTSPLAAVQSLLRLRLAPACRPEAGLPTPERPGLTGIRRTKADGTSLLSCQYGPQLQIFTALIWRCGYQSLWYRPPASRPEIKGANARIA